MTTLIRQINPDEPLASTMHRFSLMFTPVQKTHQKESDLGAYLLNPIIDAVILEPVFALDAAIEMLNAVASLAHACYLWTMTQQQREELVDGDVKYELNEAYQHFINSGSASIAELLNATLSILSLVTRPIASLLHECAKPFSNGNRYDEHHDTNSKAPTAYYIPAISPQHAHF